ncbi:hypothetical protein Bbelb_071110 [Branchiostoma belcheri]|nr:hypothetical protein Bbelb_071110 [Branchiostoma belcheri]
MSGDIIAYSAWPRANTHVLGVDGEPFQYWPCSDGRQQPHYYHQEPDSSFAITIDYTENRLYYSDNKAIYSSDMLGNNIQLVKPGDGEDVKGIAVDADYIYWVQVSIVVKLSKFSRNQTVLADDLKWPRDIFLSTASPPNVTNGSTMVGRFPGELLPANSTCAASAPGGRSTNSVEVVRRVSNPPYKTFPLRNLAYGIQIGRILLVPRPRTG